MDDYYQQIVCVGLEGAVKDAVVRFFTGRLQVAFCDKPKEVSEWLAKGGKVDLVVTYWDLGKYSGMYIVDLIQDEHPEVSIIICAMEEFISDVVLIIEGNRCSNVSSCSISSDGKEEALFTLIKQNLKKF